MGSNFLFLKTLETTLVPQFKKYKHPIACIPIDVISVVCPNIPTVLAGLTIEYSSFALI
jgi:hypothetical protein